MHSDRADHRQAPLLRPGANDRPISNRTGRVTADPRSSVTGMAWDGMEPIAPAACHVSTSKAFARVDSFRSVTCICRFTVLERLLGKVLQKEPRVSADGTGALGGASALYMLPLRVGSCQPFRVTVPPLSWYAAVYIVDRAAKPQDPWFIWALNEVRTSDPSQIGEIAIPASFRQGAHAAADHDAPTASGHAPELTVPPAAHDAAFDAPQSVGGAGSGAGRVSTTPPPVPGSAAAAVDAAAPPRGAQLQGTFTECSVASVSMRRAASSSRAAVLILHWVVCRLLLVQTCMRRYGPSLAIPSVCTTVSVV